MLIVLRGNSGSGKSSVARAVRARVPRVALVQQDVVRRDVLDEGDVAGGANIGLLDVMARYALDHGYHVVLEGIFNAGRYGEMLRGLARDNAAAFFYFDVSFEETARRHASRPEAAEFSVEDMRRWYRTRDLLGDPVERLIPEWTSLAAAADLVAAALITPA
ncbi:AAA family ATPase [Kutzneria buriramensis]|uniref:AAA family ATPase n=1 Tax=Kutzneria buriramensis TaxID=1045776 RepID=UPI001FE36978|nr:AAA family ATPase [Kutzneria buriramensis]